MEDKEDTRVAFLLHMCSMAVTHTRAPTHMLALTHTEVKNKKQRLAIHV